MNYLYNINRAYASYAEGFIVAAYPALTGGCDVVNEP